MKYAMIIDPEGKSAAGTTLPEALAGTTTGQLLAALAAEQIWSAEYSIIGDFSGSKPLIGITIPGTSQRVVVVDGEETTVAGVEARIRAAISTSLELLQAQANRLTRSLLNIDRDQAVAVLKENYPDVVAAECFDVTNDLHAFVVPAKHNEVFVARKMAGEFTGGATRIPLHPDVWCKIEPGIDPLQKHSLYWTELARNHAARRLGLPLNRLAFQKLQAIKRPEEQHTSFGPYDVTRLDFSIVNTSDYVWILFENGIPGKPLRGVRC